MATAFPAAPPQSKVSCFWNICGLQRKLLFCTFNNQSVIVFIMSNTQRCIVFDPVETRKVETSLLMAPMVFYASLAVWMHGLQKCYRSWNELSWLFTNWSDGPCRMWIKKSPQLCWRSECNRSLCSWLSIESWHHPLIDLIYS